MSLNGISNKSFLNKINKKSNLTPGHHNASAGLGLLTDIQRIAITGIRKTITNASFEMNGDSIPLNGLSITFPSSGGTFYLISTSVNDTSAGTGARTVLVKGLDSSYLEIQQVMTLNGQTSVATTSSDWFRVNQITVISAGSLGLNEGTLSMSDIDSFTAGGLPDTTVVSTVEATTNASTQGHFTTKAGHSFLTTVFKFSTDASVAKQLEIRASFTTNGILYRGVELTADGNQNYIADGFPLIPEKSDIQIFTKAKSATTVDMATCFWSAILFKDSTYPKANGI